MDSNFTGMNANLIKAQFNFNVVKKANQISVDQTDEIIIGKIYEHYFELSVTRRLSLSQTGQILVQATFNVRIDTENTENVDSITEKIRGDLPMLVNVFSRISLVISQMTSHSQYGPLITVPAYDKNKISILEAEIENQ